MNKTQLIEACAKQAKCTKAAAENALTILLNVGWVTLVKKGEEISIPDVGKLVVKKRKARKGINPLTKKPISIPASKTIVFKPAKALKKALAK
ncbi:MAG: HU family DNA-binding protein [Bacilli bacterium]|nr:HU family DNA-binding protein [Bacilli bacterium]